MEMKWVRSCSCGFYLSSRKGNRARANQAQRQIYTNRYRIDVLTQALTMRSEVDADFHVFNIDNIDRTLIDYSASTPIQYTSMLLRKQGSSTG